MTKETFTCCHCGECVQAGVTELEQRRDPQTGKILHGYALKRWWAEAERFEQTVRAMAAQLGRDKGMR